MDLLVGILSVISILSALYHVTMLLRHPEEILVSNAVHQRTGPEPVSLKRKVYLALVYVGCFAWIYLGAQEMLFFIQEDRFQLLRDTIAFSIAIFSCSGLTSLEEKMKRLISVNSRVEELEGQVKDYESDLYNLSYGVELSDVLRYRMDQYSDDINKAKFYKQCMAAYQNNKV